MNAGGLETYDFHFAFPILFHGQGEGLFQSGRGFLQGEEGLMRPLAFLVLCGGEEDFEGGGCRESERRRERCGRRESAYLESVTWC